MIYHILKYYSYIYITSLQNNNFYHDTILNYHFGKIDSKKKRMLLNDRCRVKIFSRGEGKKLHRLNCNDATKNHHVRSMEFIPPIVSLLYDSEIHFSSGISPGIS